MLETCKCTGRTLTYLFFVAHLKHAADDRPPAPNAANSSPLTVRFGVRRPWANFNPQDDDSGDKNDPMYSDPYVPTEDICPDNPVFCDTVLDCNQGSDETNCGEEGEEPADRHWTKTQNTGRTARQKKKKKSIVDGRWWVYLRGMQSF